MHTITGSWDWSHLGRVARAEVTRVVGPVPYADDAAQDALLRAWRHRDRFVRGERPDAWVAVIARREALRWARRSGERLRREDASADPAEVLTTGLPTSPECLDMRRAVNALPAADRILVALRYHADLSQPEVARVLGVPEGTVKVRLHRLRRRLAATLEETT